jgi:methylmalonyl-CoA mutase N-terminal domain/subunit
MAPDRPTDWNEAALEAIRQAKAAWAKQFARKPLRQASTTSGIELEALYTPADLPDFVYLHDLGMPAVYPHTRGIYSSMYRGRLWTMRMYTGFGTAEDTNARYKLLLKEGATGLSAALDLPTQLGYDPDASLATGEVGRVGVALSTAKDMEDLFDGIPLDQVSTNFTVNATAPMILAQYIVAGEKQSVPPEKLTGTLQNDILKEYAARGTWIFPPAPALRLTADVIEYCATHVPKFNPISISSSHLSEAGASVLQAIGYTFANAVTYVQLISGRGIDIDAFAPRLSFNLGTPSVNFFERVCALRAARRLWARIMRERFGAKDPRSWMLRFYSGVGGSMLTRQEPLNNIVRTAYEAMATVLGGAQAVHVAAFDEAYAIPTEESQRVALRIQQILADETGVADVIDPLAGSYFVEWLTTRSEQELEKIIHDLEQRGGMVKVIESGYLQQQIAQRALQVQKAIERGEQVVVGVNKFRMDEQESHEIELHQSDPATEKRQIERVQQVRHARDSRRVRDTLARLHTVAEGTENLMPAVIEATRAYATVGEITQVLRDVFGEFHEPVTL